MKRGARTDGAITSVAFPALHFKAPVRAARRRSLLVPVRRRPWERLPFRFLAARGGVAQPPSACEFIQYYIVMALNAFSEVVTKEKNIQVKGLQAPPFFFLALLLRMFLLRMLFIRETT
jgi:hypothetical protein